MAAEAKSQIPPVKKGRAAPVIDPRVAFFRLRSKKPDQYIFERETGNLVEQDSSGRIVKTIVTLPYYRKPTIDEVNEMEAAHAAAIHEANMAYEQLRRELYAATREEMQKPPVQRDRSRLFALNRQVMEADEMLRTTRFPLRFVSFEENVPIHMIDESRPTEVRKFPYPIAISATRPFTLQEIYARVSEEASEPLATLEEIRQKEREEQASIIRSLRSSSSRPVAAAASEEKDPAQLLFDYPQTEESEHMIQNVKSLPEFEQLIRDFRPARIKAPFQELLDGGAEDRQLTEYLKGAIPAEDPKRAAAYKGSSAENKSNTVLQYLQAYLQAPKVPLVIRRYLDIGSAEGAITTRLGRKLGLTPEQIHGIDMPEFAAEKIVPLPGFTAAQYTAKDRKLPYTVNEFDLVTMFQVLHHVQDPIHMLHEIQRVLKPGGVLFLREHDRTDAAVDQLIRLQHLLYSQVTHKVDFDTYRTTKYEKYFSKDALAATLTALQFEKVADYALISKENPTKIYYTMWINKKAPSA